LIISAGSKLKGWSKAIKPDLFEAAEDCWDMTAPCYVEIKGLENQLWPAIGPTSEVRLKGRGADKERTEIADLWALGIHNLGHANAGDCFQ